MNLEVQQQVFLPVTYKELNIENAYRIDLIIENKVIIEIKSVLELHPVYYSQLTTYLKLTNLDLDFLSILTHH